MARVSVGMRWGWLRGLPVRFRLRSDRGIGETVVGLFLDVKAAGRGYFFETEAADGTHRLIATDLVADMIVDSPSRQPEPATVAAEAAP